jgi:hypothetical protein
MALDLRAVIRGLLEEKKRLDSVIASLEAFEKKGPGEAAPDLKRRGRRFMPAAERHLVSERMRKYWEQRRRASARGSRQDS